MSTDINSKLKSIGFIELFHWTMRPFEQCLKLIRSNNVAWVFHPVGCCGPPGQCFKVIKTTDVRMFQCWKLLPSCHFKRCHRHCQTLSIMDLVVFLRPFHLFKWSRASNSTHHRSLQVFRMEADTLFEVRLGVSSCSTLPPCRPTTLGGLL